MSIVRLLDKTVTMAGITGTTNSAAYDLDGAYSASIQSVITVNTGAAGNFLADSQVSTANDTATITAHGYFTGLKGQATSTATLPAGITTSTNYFIIVVDADTVAFASSLANALLGTKIDLTNIGTAGATHTFTPTSLAGATVTLQKSNDGVNYDAVAAATSISATANVWFEVAAPAYRWLRLSYTLTAGSMSTVNTLSIKGMRESS